MAFFRGNKYKAKPCEGFPSRLEKAVHDILKREEELGRITAIKRQQVVVLRDCEHCGTRITWKVDFSYVDKKDFETVFVEAKGVETAEYKRKLKLWKKAPPFKLEIYKGSWQRPKLVETVEKKNVG